MTHGTISGYRHYGCRCEPCRTAHRRDCKARRAGLLKDRIVDATGTRRRIRALYRMGWDGATLSARLGYDSDGAVSVIAGRATVNVRTAERVALLYDELCMTPGPSTITRKRAESAGTPGPLAWDNIDDPSETPNVGKPGGHGVHADDIAWVCRHERHTWDTLAARFGISPHSLRAVLRRAGMHDLQARITDWSTEAAA